MLIEIDFKSLLRLPKLNKACFVCIILIENEILNEYFKQNKIFLFQINDQNTHEEIKYQPIKPERFRQTLFCYLKLSSFIRWNWKIQQTVHLESWNTHFQLSVCHSFSWDANEVCPLSWRTTSFCKHSSTYHLSSNHFILQHRRRFNF